MDLNVSELLHTTESLTAGERFLIGLSLALLGMALTMVTAILISRLRKASRERHSAKLRSHFQRTINMLIVTQPANEDPQSSRAVLSYRITELKSIIEKSALARQLLIDEIIHIKKNLTGNAVDLLCEIYTTLGLDIVSRKKLKSRHWQEKAKGIREISEMNDTAMLETVQSFLYSSNPTLTTEAMIGAIRLNREKPFAFLDGYLDEISPWVTINLYKHIAALPQNQLPDFSQWFQHSNDSVVLFALRMARQLRQARALGKLLTLMQHRNVEVVSEAILTIGDLEAFELADGLIKMRNVFWNNPRAAASFMITLEKIGAGEDAVSAATEFSSHPSYEVRFLALKILRRMSKTPVEADEAQKKILEHLNEPLLQ